MKRMKFTFAMLLPILVLTICLKGQSQQAAAKPPQSAASAVQNTWPKEIRYENGRILLYQPQPDSITGNKLYVRSAVQLSREKGTPVFGALWLVATISSDRESRQVILLDAKVLNARFPGQDTVKKEVTDRFKAIVEREIPKWDFHMTIDELTSTLKNGSAQGSQTDHLSNNPPEIIYVTEPSVLIIFDGEPVFKPTDNKNLEYAINTPFTVVKYLTENQFYFYGGSTWYKTNDLTKGTWSVVPDPPGDIKKLQKELQKAASQGDTSAAPSSGKEGAKQQTPTRILVRTHPAELLQSSGAPSFSPISGTQLLYMTNTENNIFMAIDTQLYYVLISGRWYRAPSMSGPWSYIASDKLPADFAKIPEGSEKDIVLASVAGTQAAKEAIMDAQIPQTVAVDPKSATCKVKYDGDPKFEQIKGTLLYRAVNTGSTVILSNKTYYVCENAIWFTGKTPTGPWSVATEIPAEIQKIPPDDPAYNVKYVYIYEVQPTVIYMGYLPGYMGCYVYGPTIVYGTGYPYSGWYGPYYYPRPVTWGFSMTYNPWTGWSIGFGVSFGCFHIGFGGPMYYGGWWGPPLYRPPYHMPYNHCYGHGPVYVRNTNVNINVNNYNRNTVNQTNIYNQRQGLQPVNQSTARNSGSTTASRPAGQGTDRPSTGNRSSGSPETAGQDRAAPAAKDARNNVYTDGNGNVYRKNGKNWEQHDGKGWQPADPASTGGQNAGRNKPPSGSGSSEQKSSASGRSDFDRKQMDQQLQQRDRGSQREINSKSSQQNRNFNRGSGTSRPAGGSRGGRR